LHPTPALFPAEASQRQEVERWLLWLDSTVGLATRRLAYTQIVPGAARLSRGSVHSAAGRWQRQQARSARASMTISGVLAQRFRFLHNRTDRVFEQLEQYLLLAERRLALTSLSGRPSFTAADLTLASLLRPVTVVPFFRDHPRLQSSVRLAPRAPGRTPSRCRGRYEKGVARDQNAARLVAGRGELVAHIPTQRGE
jgi:glutathione S-transferase